MILGDLAEISNPWFFEAVPISLDIGKDIHYLTSIHVFLDHEDSALASLEEWQATYKP